MDFAKFDFDTMHPLMNRVQAAHGDMEDRRSTQYVRDMAAGESAFDGAVRTAFTDTREGLNSGHVSSLTPAQTTWDDDMMTVSNRMAGAQDEASGSYLKNFNQH